MDSFTPFASLAGGALIGLSATLLMLFNGRVAGISGIISGALVDNRRTDAWRWAFLAGLLVGGVAMLQVAPSFFAVTYDRTLPMVLVAGALVGFGVRLGSGCTSGHGVCGLSRFSPRSLVATLTFIFTGGVTVLVVRLMGGAS